MRVIALDYGSARCGVAVCDPTETLVTPIQPVLAAGTRAGIGALAALVAAFEKTTRPYALFALAQGLKAVRGKLEPADAQKVYAALVAATDAQ